MGSFYVENFGCRATQADGAAIERQFRERGWKLSARSDEAEVVVLNTCTVTAAADRDARSAIRRILRKNPGCKIVVTGCYAQRAPQEIAALPGVSQVIGNSSKHELVDLWLSHCNPSAASGSSHFVHISELRAPTFAPIFVSDIFAHTELLAAPVFDAGHERTRPNLKVQDGCDNRCSFCVIPYVRGQSRSLPLDRILAEVSQLVDAGYREVVISGINLGRWGRDFSGETLRFENLLRAIIMETSLEKVRISSVEPMDWSQELIGLVSSSPRIAKHAHVPLQSGSDRILRAMHRKYRPWHYREKIEKIRDAMPDAAIGADVMTGFPGETDADFEQTRRLIQDLPLTYLHVFTYSPRPGTPAATMKQQVPVQVARERTQILRDLGEEKQLRFQKQFIGRTLDAITLHANHPQYTECLTDNFQKLKLRGKHEPNRWMGCSLTAIEHGHLLGSPAFAPMKPCVSRDSTQSLEAPKTEYLRR